MISFMTSIIVLSFAGAVISLAGMSVVIFRNLEKAKVIIKEEQESSGGSSLAKKFLDSAKIFIVHYWISCILPNFYQLAERAVLNLGGLTKRIEARLAKFSDYIKGKRKIANSGNNSEYWGGIIKFKNGLNGDSEKKE